MTTFVDTTAFYAAADRGDASHERAVGALAAADDLITSDHVLVESWILIQHRLGRDAAERFWAVIRAGTVAVEPVGPADLEVAFGIGEAFTDQHFSIVDRTSFAAMNRLGIAQAISFDDDFLVYRFGPGRRKAFVVVR